MKYNLNIINFTFLIFSFAKKKKTDLINVMTRFVKFSFIHKGKCIYNNSLINKY